MLILTVKTYVFSWIWQNVRFPQKALVYRALKIPQNEYKNIVINKQTETYLEFTYNSKTYKANLYGYGGIYLIRPDENPLWICYDVKEFKFGGNFRFVDYESK